MLLVNKVFDAIVFFVPAQDCIQVCNMSVDVLQAQLVLKKVVRCSNSSDIRLEGVIRLHVIVPVMETGKVNISNILSWFLLTYAVKWVEKSL